MLLVTFCPSVFSMEIREFEAVVRVVVGLNQTISGMPLDMNGILDAAGMPYSSLGHHFIVIDLVGSLAGGAPVRENDYGFRQHLLTRRIAIPVLEVEASQAIWALVPQLQHHLDITITKVQ